MRFVLPAALALLVVACSTEVTSPTAQVRPTTPHLSAGTGAHFMNVSASISNAGVLTFSFKEAGLGNTPEGGTVHIVASVANASATYACINGGGNHPKAANKEQVNGPLTAEGDFAVGKNGSVVGTLTISPPPSTLVCPGGQTFVLADVSYSGLSLSDAANSDFAAIDGTFLKIFFALR